MILSKSYPFVQLRLEEFFMINPAWGKKRVCTGCAVRYYDLRNPTPTCPKCGTVVDTHPTEKSKKKVLGGISSSDIEPLEGLDFELDETVDPELSQEVLDEDNFEDDLAVIPPEGTDDL